LELPFPLFVLPLLFDASPLLEAALFFEALPPLFDPPLFAAPLPAEPFEEPPVLELLADELLVEPLLPLPPFFDVAALEPFADFLFSSFEEELFESFFVFEVAISFRSLIDIYAV
jgi:hypothetical protein